MTEAEDILKAIDSLEVVDSGSSNLIAAMCDEVKLVETIDGMIKWDKARCDTTPGQRVKAMVINILDERKALYRVHEYYEKKDIEVLFGDDIETAKFNDRALGRALDKLHKAGAQKVYSTVALKAMEVHDVQIEGTIHFDTTSKSVYGMYDSKSEDDSIDVTYGHSKDYRSDLKQIGFGLGVTREGVPLYGEVLSGNSSDKAWNHDVMERIDEYLGKGSSKDIIYVADSQMVTKKTLMRAAESELRFISRLPDTFNLSEEMKDKAWQTDKWETVGQLSTGKRAASYKLQSLNGKIDNEIYRFIVVHSSALDGRKKRKIDKVVQEEKQSLSKEAKDLYSREFVCEPNAQKAIDLFLLQHKDVFYNLSREVVAETIVERRSKRRRPAKDAPVPPSRLVYRAKISIGTPKEDKIEHFHERESTFVLVTNLDDEREYPSKMILEEYKNQSIVETKFRLIKSPYILGPIFVEKEIRVEALGYVLLMALLIAILLERCIRNNLKKENVSIVIPGRKKTLTPTVTMVLDMLATIQVLRVKVKGKTIRKLDAPTRLFDISRLLRLAGFDETIYTGTET